LGKRIVREFDLENSTDTLARWMAHRVAELMECAEQAQIEEDKEAARRECTNLIMRLWERRSYWPHGRPLAEVAEFLEKLISAPVSSTYNRMESKSSEHTWIGIFPLLLRLQEREQRLCRDAALADISLEKEREWLAEHGEEISTEERQIIERMLTLRERLDSPYYLLDDDAIPDFASLPAEERTQRVFEALNEINAERQALFASVMLLEKDLDEGKN
jgi:hypothetical protein